MYFSTRKENYAILSIDNFNFWLEREKFLIFFCNLALIITLLYDIFFSYNNNIKIRQKMQREICNCLNNSLYSKDIKVGKITFFLEIIIIEKV